MSDNLKHKLGGTQDTDLELPDPKDEYKAYARVSGKPVFTLHFILGKDGLVSFQYKDLDSNTSIKMTDRGQAITLRFGGIKPVEIVITGRSLFKLYDYIHQHRMPWVMKADRDFAVDKEPVINQVTITGIKE